MNTLVLWDIDGTIIRNSSTAGTLYLDAVEDVVGVRPTERVADPHGMTEGQLITALLVANQIDTDNFPAIYERLERLSLAELEAGRRREPCAGISAALSAVAERGWINGLLTGNGPQRARYKILAAGIDAELFDWTQSFFGHQSPTRHHLTAIAQKSITEHNAVIVGDTPKDGEAADSAGIPFLAVATGIYSAADLQKTNALIVIDDFVTGLEEALNTIAALPAQVRR